MSEPLARLYDLALRTLDDQERRADALRGRLAPTLAAAALGVTLLSGPLVGGAHPTTLPGTLALLLAVGGFFVAAGAAALMLTARRRSLRDLDVWVLADRLRRDGVLDDLSAFYAAIIAHLSREARENTGSLERLRAQFTAMLCGMLAMLCGLALAALVG